jgi:hypothetical protein
MLFTSISYSKKFIIFKNFFDKMLLFYRLKIFNIFKQEISFNANSKILDVGTVSLLDKNENVFIHQYPYKDKITCLSDQDCSELLKIYSDIKIFIGDGRNLGFKDNTFDIVHSNATIEHVGSCDNQFLFIKELIRVSKKYVFLTTPSRLFLFDLHTKYPLLHWFPKVLHRKILKILGDDFFSLEENLNLLSKKDLINFCKRIDNIEYKFYYNKIFLFNCNIILLIKKK